MLVAIHKKAQEVFADNASTILTAGGVVGTVTTAVLSVRAGWKAQEIISDEEELRAAEDPDGEEMSKGDKIKATWPLFAPPVVTGAATVSAIIMSNRINAKNAAAWAAAYAASQKQRDEYKAKLEEKLGIKKSEDARTEMHRERTEKNAADRAEIIIVSGGAVLCYDQFSDRYIRTSAEKIRQAEKKCKEAVNAMSEVSLETFYDELGFDKVPFGDMLGWNINNPPNITIDTILVNDEPCLCIDFVNLPFAEWKTEY